MSVRNKFYEIQEQWNNLHWHTLNYFRKKADAEEWVSMYESRDHKHPIKVLEREFSSLKEYK